MENDLRKTGMDLIGNVSWGTHLCQFYQTPEDLIDILVPYFKAGLENNEFCMWITAEPLTATKAEASLKKVVRNLDDSIEKGQIEILDYSQWYTKSGKFDADETLGGWIEKKKQALERGFDGLRLTGNSFWLEDKDWRDFTKYEKMVNDVIGNYKMLAVCSYSLDKCGASEILDVVANHQFALVKRENRWEIVESSEHKQEALRESEKRLRLSLTGSGVSFWEWFPQNGRIHFDEHWAKFLGLGYDPGENDFNLEWWNESIHPDNKPVFERALNDYLEGRKSRYELEYQIQTKTGDWKWIWAAGECVEWDKNRKPVRFLGTHKDITKSKQAEEQIQKSLREKMALLREINHRVKNNLQVISSLLDLSSMRAQDQKTISLFTNIRSKIQTMALIHSQAFQNGSFNDINIESHIREQVRLLSAVYSKNERITPVFETSDIHLSLSQAIPCALVCNELISNAFKHAFRKVTEGIIEISIQKSDNDTIYIRIRDNGVPISEEINIYKTDTLGLKLVRNIVQQQLHGKIQLKRNNGTEFIIEFKLLKEELGHV